MGSRLINNPSLITLFKIANLVHNFLKMFYEMEFSIKSVTVAT